jgi:hypothetical protein
VSDPSTPSFEPTQADEVLRADLAAIADLAAAGIEIDGEAHVCETTWVLYGHTSYDGEIVVGQFHDEAEASAVLRSLPRNDAEQAADHGGPIP